MASDDVTAILAERGSTIFRALTDMGAEPNAATGAAEWYVNLLSWMYTGARNIAFMKRSEPDVTIADFDSPALKSVVMRNGREWGKIWLERREPPVFEFETYTEDPQLYQKGSFDVHDGVSSHV